MSRYVRIAAFFLGVCFICFFTGASLAAFRYFPYRIVRNVFSGGRAALILLGRHTDNRWTHTWNKRRGNGFGVIRHDEPRSYSGYTLYSSAHAQAAYLVSMDGRLAHQWALSYRDIWDTSAEVAAPPPDRYCYWRKSKVFPNGDLIALCVEAGMTPWGLGLVKVDASSRLIWKYLGRVHHDFRVASDGRIYTLTHRIRNAPLYGMDNIRAPFLEDFVTVLDASGREIESFSLHEAVKRSPSHFFLTRVNQNDKGDFLHANAIELLEGETAQAFPFAKEGQLLISFRDISFIGILDLPSRSFIWGTTGPWIEQHDPDFLPNGNILLFDNHGRMFKPGGRSRVMEFNPVTHAIEWSFEGSAQRLFFSEVRSSQQRLPNGNTLITESDPGIILEVTPDRDVVWEYVNPVCNGTDSSVVPAVCWASRIAEDEFETGFLRLLQP